MSGINPNSKRPVVFPVGCDIRKGSEQGPVVATACNPGTAIAIAQSWNRRNQIAAAARRLLDIISRLAYFGGRGNGKTEFGKACAELNKITTEMEKTS